MRRLALLAVLGALLAGCTPDPAPAPVASDHDPIQLIGSWRLEGADEQGAVLRVAGDDMSLFRRCGMLSGTWRADEAGLFIGYLFSATGCPPVNPPTPAWLARVSRYRIDTGGPALLDEGGAVIARLRPGGVPTPVPTYMRPEGAAPPTLTDRARERLAPAAPLPAGLTPARRPDLLGTWRHGSSFVELRVDGGWGGSDGCNSAGGRWAYGPGGAIIAVSGAMTAVACPGGQAPFWLTGARRVAVDAGTLVLIGGDGSELGRLLR